MEWDDELEGEHGSKEHGPIDPSLGEADLDDDDDVGLLGGGGPAATLDDDEEFDDELDDRPDSAL
jgi:hypothetical protein